MMGNRYIDQPTFNMKDTFEDSSAPTPLFFVLFPGVDPGCEIEKLGRELGFTEANGKYKSISMGQGQEKNAENALVKYAEEGGWAFLQSVPEGILQSSIKVSNEPPSDLKSNLRGAYALFSQETLEASTKPQSQ